MRGFVVQHTPKPLPVGAPSHGGIAFLDRDGVLNIEVQITLIPQMNS